MQFYTFDQIQANRCMILNLYEQTVVTE